MRNRIMVAAVFLVGCAVGGGASQFVVPKASAQQAGTLTKWEYTCIDAVANSHQLVTEGNRAGLEGWEMFLAQGNSACFKRPRR